MNSMYFARTSKAIFLSSFFIVALVFNMATFAPKAQAWWTISNIFGTLTGNLLDIVKEQIKGALLASLKVATVTALNSQVGQMIGGTSVANALFVTDWEEFIYDRSAEQVTVYMNDFFTMTTRGKYASANYSGLGGDAYGADGNYPAYLVATAKQAVQIESPEASFPQYDMDQYGANPQELFAEGDFRGLHALTSNPMNNPFGFTLTATAYAAAKMNQTLEAKKTELTSSGFVGKKSGGKTIAPAATIENMLSDAQNIGNNIIAAAENDAILTDIVTAMVNRVVTNMVQKGVGKIQANIEKEIKKVDNQVVKALNKVNKELGPGAQFLRETSQKTNAVKAYTDPPPSYDNGVYCDGGC